MPFMKYIKIKVFRKIKINKQPTILDKKYAKSIEPYSEFSEEEIELKNQQLDNEQFLENLDIVLKRESEEYMENKSQEIPYEEETIYSKNLNYKDSFIMKDFHNENWDKKWIFAEKFLDPRLRFFAADIFLETNQQSFLKKYFLYYIKNFRKTSIIGK